MGENGRFLWSCRARHDTHRSWHSDFIKKQKTIDETWDFRGGGLRDPPVCRATTGDNKPTIEIGVS